VFVILEGVKKILKGQKASKSDEWFVFVPYAGWQWVPVRWQGWLVTLALIVSLVSLFLFFIAVYGTYSPYVIIPLFLLLTLALCLLYFYICSKKSNMPPELQNWPFS
jgi:4-amino-4-deoxy-L-arabinose transferase-like glycosyltransferase